MRQQKAILAGGCYWGVQEFMRRRTGVISTRVGYSGGDTANPTDNNPGDHAEAVEVVYDADAISFRGVAGVLLPDPRSDDAQPARR
jgi:peptide-methionine (S)-S-oxide reductase